MKVGLIDDVVVDEADLADAGRGQVERQGRAQPAGADRPPVPISSTLAALSFFCPSSATSGMIRCRL